VAVTLLEPAGMFWIAQVATPVEDTAAVQPAMVTPFSAKVIVPEGMTGVKVTPVSVAVKVTFVFNGEGLAGAGVRFTVGCSEVMV
jgi:hypothetical protein